MNSTEWISIFSLFIALLSFLLAYRSAKIQTETFLMTLLAGKANEANVFNDLAALDPKSNHYQNALAAIVQAIQIYELIVEKYKYFIWQKTQKKFMSVFFLQWRTNLQNKIFDKKNNFDEFLIRNKTEDEILIIQSHLNLIRQYLKSSRDEFQSYEFT